MRYCCCLQFLVLLQTVCLAQVITGYVKRHIPWKPLDQCQWVTSRSADLACYWNVLLIIKVLVVILQFYVQPFLHLCIINIFIFSYVNFGLTNTANANNNFKGNDLVYINNTLVQVKSNMTLQYTNQYFCFRVVHVNSRPSQLLCGLPIAIGLSRDLPLYTTWISDAY